MQNLPDLRQAEASRTSFAASFAADRNTQAFGYDNQNDDAKIAALLQSGACKSKAALATKLRLNRQNKTGFWPLNLSVESLVLREMVPTKRRFPSSLH